jgi:hypothetical protein
MNKNFIVAWMAAMLLFTPLEAKEKLSFPPYPNVWGVELPPLHACNVLYFEDTNGDIVIEFDSNEIVKPFDKNSVYSFLQGNTIMYGMTI